MTFRTEQVLFGAGRQRSGEPIQVRAEVELPGDPVEPSILLTHGAGGDLSTRGLKAMSAGLAEAGHLVVRADLPYRALGRKTPPPAEKSVDGFMELATGARTRFGPDRAWVVGGRSYGGRVASMAVASGLEASGLLLYSYPLHRPGNPTDPRVQHWPLIKVPCLFLEGTNDPFCDLDLLHAHLGSLGGGVTVHIVPGGEHSLKVAAGHAPDGKPRSEQATVTGLIPIIRDWLAEVGRSRPRR